MNFNTAATFSKIDLFFVKSQQPGLIKESTLSDLTKATPDKSFSDAAMVITGDILLIIQNGNNGENTDVPKYTVTEIFKLGEIKNYITYSN
jgi:hypothetical protein